MLVVDDEATLSELLSRRCGTKAGRCAARPTAARRARSPRVPPRRGVLDVMLPDFDGLEVPAGLRSEASDVPVLF